MEEFLKELGIEAKGTISKEGNYIVDLKDYQEYGKYFSVLDKAVDADKIEVSQDNTLITSDTTNLTYLSDEYQIQLLGDLNEDIYKIVVTKF